MYVHINMCVCVFHPILRGNANRIRPPLRYPIRNKYNFHDLSAGTRQQNNNAVKFRCRKYNGERTNPRRELTEKAIKPHKK